jgi:FixJ family two-component response regulator
MDASRLVLVVDDDAEMLRGLGRMLRQFGYASLLFSSARSFESAAFESAAFESPGNFDGAVCVLLDIQLGDGSGIEVRQGLKAAGITVPVIFMTGNDSPEVRIAAYRSGCLAYLTKPFSARSLMEPLASLPAA